MEEQPEVESSPKIDTKVDTSEAAEVIIKMLLIPFETAKDITRKLAFFGSAEAIKVHVLSTLMLTGLLVLNVLYGVMKGNLGLTKGFVPPIAVFFALIGVALFLYVLGRTSSSTVFIEPEVEAEEQYEEELAEEDDELPDIEDGNSDWLEEEELVFEETDPFPVEGFPRNMEFDFPDEVISEESPAFVKPKPAAEEPTADLMKYFNDGEKGYSEMLEALKAEEEATLGSNTDDMMDELSKLLSNPGGDLF